MSLPGLTTPINNVDKRGGGGSNSYDDDNGTIMNQQSRIMDYATTNTINDEYMMELSSANVNKTFFRSSNNSVITSQVGSIVLLPCRVHIIGDEMVMKKFIFQLLPLLLLLKVPRVFVRGLKLSYETQLEIFLQTFSLKF
jgi:hypothetical protein